MARVGRVVRSEGASIFGRSDELAGIRALVCPDITAASAAAARVASLLTLRGHGRRFEFITAHARAREDLGRAGSLSPILTACLVEENKQCAYSDRMLAS